MHSTGSGGLTGGAPLRASAWLQKLISAVLVSEDLSQLTAGRQAANAAGGAAQDAGFGATVGWQELRQDGRALSGVWPLRWVGAATALNERRDLLGALLRHAAEHRQMSTAKVKTRGQN